MRTRSFLRHNTLLWCAAVALAFLSGMAVMQGQANMQAMSQINGSWHWTLRHELAKREAPSQQNTSLQQ